MHDHSATTMTATPAEPLPPSPDEGRSRFGAFITAVVAWLTPWRCRALFAALIAFGFVANWRYLNYDTPLDLSGDEAHYWDWSRALDWAYYSKGPVVAYLIRASCAIFGENMPAVRFPAMVLAVCTATLTYWLIVRLFKSDRLALGATLLSAFVPAFMAGSLLMTIDPPFYFMWGLATAMAALAVLEDRKWPWIVLGFALGIGALAKYGMFLWLAGFVLFLALDRPSRRYLKSPWFYGALAIAAACMIPVLVWNARYGWVTAKHIDAGTSSGFKIGSPFEMLGSQAAVLGLSLFFIVVGAVAYVFRREGKADPHYRVLRFLVCIGATYFAICFLNSFRSKIQPNWPAPSYFTLLILGAYFLGLRLRQPGKWRPWWIGNLVMTIIPGILLTPVARDPSKVYWIVPYINKVVSPFRDKPFTERHFDPTARLRGWADLGQTVGEELKKLGPGAFVMTEDYQRSSLMAFYVPGQPKTYCCASYVNPPRRNSQFDIWQDRALEPDKTDVLGKDCVFVGFIDRWPDIRKAFASVEPLPDVIVKAGGVPIVGHQMWICRDFKGMTRPEAKRW